MYARTFMQKNLGALLKILGALATLGPGLIQAYV